MNLELLIVSKVPLFIKLVTVRLVNKYTLQTPRKNMPEYGFSLILYRNIWVRK